ncbi:GntR family transcriptional regulator [Streptomyces natalensis]|uniref:GntR family transcriptional regulator n=1 Tax=Streptomyces natalensis ATCC 27448 TaxID=1240678 RepID=A0A0D7CHB8_9ACTN|nr:GntR family transcriptional regulator [Streptomyces natalensis]KIZ15603.1 GntR family transcriptional regulator [Streptomyces natalensis ATCC 27448]
MEQGTAEREPRARAWAPAHAGSAVPQQPGRRSAVPRQAPRPQRHSVRGQVLAALREALVGGELAPGEVYSAPVLAERYGVSATPVREAMQQLAGEGAVEVVPNRGFRVCERSSRDLAELAEVRAMLEVPAVIRLAGTLEPERWEELRPLAEAGVSAAAHGDRAGYAEADRAFHRGLISLTGNHRLTQVTDELLRATHWPAGGARLRRAELLAGAAEHTALLDALIAQEYAVAERIAREHLSVARHAR